MNAFLSSMYNASPPYLQNILLSGYGMVLERERYRGEFNEFRTLMSKAQWQTESELAGYQDEQLARIIDHAYMTVPYYRNIFDKLKLKPRDIRSKTDLNKLPLLTKDDIKRNFKLLISSACNPKKLRYGHTSGTTGSPLEIAYDSRIIHITYAALDRHYDWARCRLAQDGDRIAVARGNIIVPLSSKSPPFWRYNNFHNQLLLSSFHMSRNNLELYFSEMERYGVVALDGYPSTLYILARYLKNGNRTMPLRAVISSSETLYDFQREVIEDSFECPVSDYYALAERVVFSSECERHEGHHIAMEYGISEVCDRSGAQLTDGEWGHLVGTSLHNFGMPLIRYVTSDFTRIKKDKCSCGRGLQLMDAVTTKAEDTLTLKDGRLISPSVLTHPFKPLNSIEESQIVQKEYDRIVIRIVPRKDYSESDTQHLQRELHKRLGEDVKIEFEFMDSLARTASGKFRWVISEVPLGI